MGTILQDMMGMLSRKKAATPKTDDYVTIARYTSAQERMKPHPKVETELVTMGAIKTFVNAGNSDSQQLSIVGQVLSLTNGGSVTIPDEYVNSAAFDGATDLLTLARVSGGSIQIDMNRKDVKEFVNFTLISASTAAPVQLPVAAPGQLFIVASAGAGANATVNLPNASATQWVFRKATITTNGSTSSSRTLTLNAAGSENINGAGTLVLDKLYASVTLWSDGTNWIVLSSSQVTVV